jgi:hypothetical protein
MPISRLSATSCVGLELRPLPSTGVTRLRQYYGPLRYPSRTSLSLAGVWLRGSAPSPIGFPVLRWISLYRHAVVITPVARWVLIARGTVYSNRFHSSPAAAAFPIRVQGRRHIGRFEACSTFTRVTACRLAESPCDPSVSKAPTVSLPPHELPRLVRCVGRLRGGCFWLECWTMPTIPPTPGTANRSRRIWFLSVVHGHRPVAMATASIHSPTAWAAD